MAVFIDIKGTSQGSFQLSKGGARINNTAGVIEARNAADNAYADIVGQILKANSNELQLNANATLSGANWKMSVLRPATGMTANVNYTLPAAPINGSLLATDGSGNLSWTAPGAVITGFTVMDSQSFVFNSASPIALVTIPANAVVHSVEVIIDTLFDGAPTLQVGIAGTTNKYMDTTEVNLNSGLGDIWKTNPSKAPLGTSEAIIATYTQGGSTVGAGRILVNYSIPN